jgi:hypothetical protein
MAMTWSEAKKLKVGDAVKYTGTPPTQGVIERRYYGSLWILWDGEVKATKAISMRHGMGQVERLEPNGDAR